MPDRPSPVELALGHVEAGDLAGAQNCLQADGDGETIGARYAELTGILYARNKDVAGMLALGRAGIDYQLHQAERAAADDSALSLKLRTAAKSLAFNVAANCWPGWSDDGVVIEPAHIEDGLELAKLSLGLVEELELAPGKLATASWLVGALDLAAGRPEAAMASFDRARTCSLLGGERS